MSFVRKLGLLAGVVFAVVLGACSQEPTAPTATSPALATTKISAALVGTCDANFGPIYSFKVYADPNDGSYRSNMTLHVAGLSQNMYVQVIRKNYFGQTCGDFTQPVTWTWSSTAPNLPYPWNHYIQVVNQTTQAMSLRGLATTWASGCNCYLYIGLQAKLTNYPSWVDDAGVRVQP